MLAPEERDVIRRNRLATTCYLVADSDECVRLVHGRVRAVTGRNLVHVTSQELPTHLPNSWLLAVLVCPGDDLARVAAWARQLPLRLVNRIRFYELPMPEPGAAYQAWAAASLPRAQRRLIEGFRDLNRLLGMDLNMRILADHGQPA